MWNNNQRMLRTWYCYSDWMNYYCRYYIGVVWQPKLKGYRNFYEFILISDSIKFFSNNKRNNRKQIEGKCIPSQVVKFTNRMISLKDCCVFVQRHLWRYYIYFCLDFSVLEVSSHVLLAKSIEIYIHHSFSRRFSKIFPKRQSTLIILLIFFKIKQIL